MATTMVKCGPTWLSEIGSVGELEWSTRWGNGGGGCWEASWRMALPPRFFHPSLRRGQIVQIMVGPQRVWYGFLDEPEPTAEGWNFAASGMVKHRFLAFDGSLASTSIPNTAVDQAIARGWAVTRPASLSGSAFTGASATDELNYVPDLLNDWADEAGKNWGIFADGKVIAAVNPTEPTWWVRAGASVMGIASDGFATNLYGRYKNLSAVYTTATASDAAAAARWGVVEEAIDMTPLGAISSTRAGNRLSGVLNKGKARLRWTNAVEVARAELTTAGGVQADPRLVRAGQMARLFGIHDQTKPGRLAIDVVIGETKYREDEGGVLTISPVDKARRTPEEIFERVLQRQGVVRA